MLQMGCGRAAGELAQSGVLRELLGELWQRWRCRQPAQQAQRPWGGCVCAGFLERKEGGAGEGEVGRGWPCGASWATAKHQVFGFYSEPREATRGFMRRHDTT